MSKGFLLYLNGARFSAACLVAMSHLFISSMLGWRDIFLGADAVIAFFVISGFVVAWVADKKENDLPTFAIARISRLVSVLLPAMALTVALDSIGIQIDHIRYIPLDAETAPSPLTLLPSLFFLNEVWTASVSPMSNQPVWSLCYEFWYYAIFGAYYYLRGRVRWLAIAVIVLIAGPKILLLLPAWLMGVTLYVKRDLIKLSSVSAVILMGLTINIIVMFENTGIGNANIAIMRFILGENFNDILGHSTNFIWLNFVGMMVAMHFAAVYSLLKDVNEVPRRLEACLNWLGRRTFSIYLLHMPIMLLFSVVVRKIGLGWNLELLAPFVAIVFSSAIGGYLEHLRFPLRTAIQSTVRRVEGILKRGDLKLGQFGRRSASGWTKMAEDVFGECGIGSTHKKDC
jgi:peptidoglycan/LPS O-acetylase OafA/YrhL